MEKNCVVKMTIFIVKHEAHLYFHENCYYLVIFFTVLIAILTMNCNHFQKNMFLSNLYDQK